MPFMPSMRLTLLAAAVAVLVGCATPPPPAPSKPPVDVPAPVAPEPVPAPAPMPEPVAPPPSVPSGPVSAAQQQQAQKQAMAAIEMLDAGNEDQARSELQSALAADPNNRLAQNLMRQITADPVATLGKEFFNYTVRSTDTLSRIAGRFLNDIYAFYILARYNDIKSPRQVSTGQVLKIPGKAPPPGADRDPPAPPRPAPPPPPAAVPAPPPPPPPPAAPPPAPRPDPAAQAAEAKRVSQRHVRDARAAAAREDLCAAIASYGRALEADPTNDTAKLERQQATVRRDRLNLSCR